MNPLEMVPKLFWKKNSLPVHFIFFVTNRCNARCPHCFYWESLGKSAEELTLDEIDKFSRTMHPLYHINLTGGEPFLRDDLDGIISKFYEHAGTKSFGIATNGYSPDRIRALTKDVLSKHHGLLLKINVSIDHLRERHDQIRGYPGLFDLAVSTVKELKNLKMNNLTVSVNLTVTKDNQDDIEDIYMYIRDSICPDKILPVLIRSEPKDPELKNVSPEAYNRLMKLWQKDLREGKFSGYSGGFLGGLIVARDLSMRQKNDNVLAGKEGRITCFAGVLTGVMYANGDVAPCEMLSDRLGNIRDFNYDFRKLWLSTRAQQFSKRIRNEKCSCTHECFQSINLLFNLRSLLKLLRRQITFKKTKHG